MILNRNSLEIGYEVYQMYFRYTKKVKLLWHDLF